MTAEAHHIEVRKTARYYMLGDPGQQVRKIWFACHGYRQLARFFVRNFQSILDGETLVVVPEALHRFYLEGDGGRVGASWMTRDDREADISDYVAYLDQLFEVVLASIDNREVQVNALGFSQGSATVCRWLANGRSKVDNLVIWAGTFPPDLNMDTAPDVFQQMNIKLVLGKSDPYAGKGLLEKQISFLTDNEIAYELVEFEGGHAVDPAVLQKVARGL